jgi:CDP-diacylglycerol--glycerol-3-phosphate 3-phosphatidyltransferase
MPDALEKPVGLPKLKVDLFTLANQLTALRLGLSVALFALLAFCDAADPAGWTTLLNVGLVLFAAAGLTDALDGWVARRMGTVSVFGRMMDPFVDKVLVVGCLTFLSGGTFWREGRSLTGLAPWMTAVVLTREFLITGLRSFSELQGVNFEAGPAGKAKMTLQTAVVGWLLFALANCRTADGVLEPWAYGLSQGLILAMLAATVWSGLAYLERARRFLSSADPAKPGSGSDRRG